MLGKYVPPPSVLMYRSAHPLYRICVYCPLAGSTLTVLLVIGGILLTVANVGDSDAVLDTGCSMLEVSSSHRIHDCVREQARLRTAGCRLAQVCAASHGIKGSDAKPWEGMLVLMTCLPLLRLPPLPLH